MKEFAEFFAGIGLVHAALRTRGWSCVYANDISEQKREMYQHYFGDSDYYQVGDIWETDAVVERIPKVELVTASFPCTDLSLAGNRLGLRGVQSGTFYGFSKVLEALALDGRLPNAVLIENVMGFLSANKGGDFEAVCQKLASLGYFLDVFTLDAKYFTPQSRPRLFIVGCLRESLPKSAILKDSESDAILGEWEEEIHARPALRPSKIIAAIRSIKLLTGWMIIPTPPLPKPQHTFDSVVDLGDGLDWWPELQINKHLDEMSSAHRVKVEQLQLGAAITVGTIYRRVRDGGSRSEIRIDGLAGCLRTPRGGSSKQIVFVAGNGRLRMRWMTADEYGRLQGAGDFPIRVPRNQALFGFGDAVCVPAIAWIADHFLQPIAGTSCHRSDVQRALEPFLLE